MAPHHTRTSLRLMITQLVLITYYMRVINDDSVPTARAQHSECALRLVMVKRLKDNINT